MFVMSCLMMLAPSKFGDKQGLATLLHEPMRLGAVIPYKNRQLQLPRVLDALKTFDMDILVVEPGYDGAFNRGWLLDVGAHLLMKRSFDYTCLVFHDVDYLPLANVSYNCATPTQVIAYSTTNGKAPKPVYGSAGVQTISPSDFRLVNGYATSFLGWGGEDDDFHQRLAMHHKHLRRSQQGLFKHMQTGHTKRDFAHYKHNKKLLSSIKSRMQTDGLSNLTYVVRSYVGDDKLAWALVSK